ncbi:ribonuclease P protein component [Muribaculum intestinale]|nr:ribonuclease P protein component [Muribaculum intestinale]ROT09049.1 ribonuclease P protein component [Muribaculaceae bacterium Isolate-100 (HZI)]RXE66868.1 ribonuclease P protein component [Muribaculaceae bacterium Isolate-007 (NCI)]
MVNISQHTFRLYKREKLCSDTAIDLLFSRQGGGQAALFFPLRVVWRHNQARSGGAQFMISVPKKRLRHAVDRVAMRRLIREAYRLNRRHLGEAIDMPVDIAFAYVADRHTDFRRVSHAMIKSLRRIAKSVLPDGYDSETDNSTRDKVQQ